MNPYNFSVLLFTFGSFFVGLLIWLKREDRIGWFYFIFSSFVTVWGVAWSVLISDTVPYPLALFCSKLAHSMAALIAVTWWHFTLIYTDRDQNPKFKRALVLFYFAAFLICLSAFTPWFVRTVGSAAGFRYYTKPGFIFHLFMVLYWMGVIFGFLELLWKLKRLQGDSRFHLSIFFIAAFSGFLGGSLVQAPIYGISLPQYNLFLMPVYPFIMAFLLIRSRLFDVEQMVQAFQKEKLATLGLLAASINHEIRNPLYAVKGLLETFIENEKEGLPRKTPLETSEKALKQVSRALEVISKLNRFAKPAGESSSQIGSIPDAIQAVLDLVSYEFSLEKIAIKNLLPNDLPKIQTDQRQLEEILFNLIVNACQAMKGGGELVIASERSERSNAGTVQITIQDTGTGISPDQSKHLFEPFHTTKGEQGTGLGLYITKQLIERNSGKITVKSQEGKGTSFTLEFKKV